ncbi:DUF1573 domain-containing protein [Tuwongella immobilis]|uniref:: DUF1573 n=1 Tax=Tuwongella immobilis TaxID=692036 RepID=A0A6C2YQY8_9BACT|nr:DUF1573 domain-containing protein [Tuwongella immobilis]VIP03569.1 : DUF1573 [Tuwongella immobilis]VTS04506.1 : DUF1573 [Tuwongella immobilis]
MTHFILPLLLLAPTDGASIAPLMVTPTHSDCGKILAGTPIVKTFQIRNTSPAVLEIASVRPSCGCQRWTLSAQKLEPNATATLTVTVGTLAQTVGGHRWTIALTPKSVESQQDLPETRIELTGLIERRLTVVPTSLSIPISDRWHTIRVEGVADREKLRLRPTKIPDGLEVQLASGGNQCMVSLRVKPGAKVPTGWMDLGFATDDPQQPNLSFPIEIRPQERPQTVQHTPEQWVFQPAKSTEMQSALFQVRRGDGQPIRLISARCDQPGISVTAANGAFPVFPIRVRFDPTKVEQAMGNAEVILMLQPAEGMAAPEEHRIPVRWILP